MQIVHLEFRAIFNKHTIFYSKFLLLDGYLSHQLDFFFPDCSVDGMFGLALLHDEMCLALSESLNFVLHVRSIKGFCIEAGVHFGFRLLDKLYLFL